MKSVFLAAALLLTGSVYAAVIDVDSLNQILKAEKAGWTAKQNPVNQLSMAEAKFRLGVQLETDAVRFSTPKASSMTGLPAVLDWRNQMGSNWVSPILDQGNCGSCVAFAAIGALETQYKIASGFSGFNIKLSPQHLFSCGGGFCDFGWRPENAASYLQSQGVPDESCMPYISGATGQDVACSASCGDSARRSVRIAAFATPTRSAKDLNSLRQALQKGPLVTTLGVYADFMAYASGVYKHTTGAYMGGHAVSIVGYDDNRKALLIRNSWGEGWGDKGFAYISYDDTSGVGDQTWGYQMPSMNGAVTVEGPIDYTYVSGEMQLKAYSTFADTDSIGVVFFNSNGQSVWSTVCAKNSCNQTVNVSQMPDGRYDVQATATSPNGQIQGVSARQFFYISNQKPVLSLSFTGVNGTDLDKPLKKRIEVAVSASSSPVPMSSIEFHYRGADGVDVVRTASVVVDGMSMGWRTNLVANGSYEIWMVGRVKTNAMETVVETPHKTVSVSN